MATHELGAIRRQQTITAPAVQSNGRLHVWVVTSWKPLFYLGSKGAIILSDTQVKGDLGD